MINTRIRKCALVQMWNTAFSRSARVQTGPASRGRGRRGCGAEGGGALQCGNGAGGGAGRGATGGGERRDRQSVCGPRFGRSCRPRGRHYARPMLHYTPYRYTDVPTQVAALTPRSRSTDAAFRKSTCVFVVFEFRARARFATQAPPVAN